MSRWVHNSSSPSLQGERGPSPSQEEPSAEEKKNFSITSEGEGGSVKIPLWIKALPFFLSAVFFISAVFAILAPLPLLALRFRKREKLFVPAIICNVAIVFFSAGVSTLILFFVFSVVPVFVISEALKHRKSLEKTVIMALVAMMITGGIAFVIYSMNSGSSPVAEIKQQVSAAVDYIENSVSGHQAALSGLEYEEWKNRLILEFPSALLILSLLLVTINTVMLIRLNPDGLRDKLGLAPQFLQSWRAPTFLVWPAIATGALLIFGSGLVADISLNL
ncbi:MAG: DUF2232 domain-containing protein, partial [Candidatus Poribacteria bacterium]